MVHTPSNELRCNHNTLVGWHWWTERVASTPRSTCTWTISTWTQTRRLRGTNQKWPRHVALRKRVLDEIIIDVWTETNEHEENAERQKHEQTVILKSNSGWKTFWRTITMRERQPPGNKTGCAPTPFHQEKRQTATHQTPQATHSGQPCKMIQTSQHPHWRRNMRFLMCPNLTWNTVPLGGHADSHTIKLTAPPSQQLADTLLHLPLPHWEVCTERRTKDNLVTSLCDKGVRDELITDVLQWRNTLTNKQAKRTRSTNRTYDIETQLLVKTFARTTSIARTWVLWTSTASTLNLVGPNTQFKHTRTNNLNFTNCAPTTHNSKTHGKPSKYYELQRLEC